MAIKINNTTVIDNSRKGFFDMMNVGSYTADQLKNLVVSGTAVGDCVINSNTGKFTFWDGTKWLGLESTGGTIFTPGNGYQYHTFLSNGIYSHGSLEDLEFLVVAGGGAGGNSQGGGGGAGGIVQGIIPSAQDLSSLIITVGEGGLTSPGPQTDGGSGFDSSIGDLVLAKGGGGGGGGAYPGRPGGSGGAGSGAGAGGTSVQPTTLNTWGINYGTNGAGPAISAPSNGNGGGGAGSAGVRGQSGSNGYGGDGMPFVDYSYPLCFPAAVILTFTNPSSFPPSASSSHYGGGGSGGSRSPHGSPRQGGIGGGGRGTPGPGPSTVYPGVDFLGAGGGGGSSPGPGYSGAQGGKGGSGVVILRYRI